MTININPINDLTVDINTKDTVISLFNHFDDPFTTGKVANFKLTDNSIGNGEINIVLFDQTGEGAPITVNNFVNYVNSGSYVYSIIHRSVVTPIPFVIQGGGFTVNNITLNRVPTNPPIQNEFSANRSNVRGTIAMAKVGNDPNSATSQWFFNLSDNSANLNNQNGGFTVFGKVISQKDLNTVDAIASLPVVNASSVNPAFDTLPVNPKNVDINNPSLDQDEDFIRFEKVSIRNEPELTFSIANNSNSNVVRATVNNQGQLTLDYGNRLRTPLYRFQNSQIPGTYLFVGETEKNNILQQFPQFKLEGLAFQVANEEKGDPLTRGNADITVKATNLLGESVTETFNINVTGEIPQNNDQLTRFYRFQNRNKPGTYLYADEAERVNIRNNFPNFIEEGTAFYAYGANSNQGEKIYRFQNTQQPGTYLFVGEAERQNIIANFPQFVQEGVAFEVVI